MAIRQTTRTGRKRDRRTVLRVAAEWTQRARSASEAASVGQAERRLEYLPLLASMRTAGVSLSQMAREFEARGVLTMRGKRLWEPTTVRNLLAVFDPYLRWRDGADLANPASRREFYSSCQKALGGRLLQDWVKAAFEYETSVLMLLPVLPRPAGYGQFAITETVLRSDAWLQVDGEVPPTGVRVDTTLRPLPARRPVALSDDEALRWQT